MLFRVVTSHGGVKLPLILLYGPRCNTEAYIKWQIVVVLPWIEHGCDLKTLCLATDLCHDTQAEVPSVVRKFLRLQHPSRLLPNSLDYKPHLCDVQVNQQNS